MILKASNLLPPEFRHNKFEKLNLSPNSAAT